MQDQLATECCENDHHIELCEQIGEVSAKIKVDFLREQIPDAVAESVHGISRVAEIVAAMREFSHPGEDECTPIDINQAIQSTITISRHEWKYVADIETDFDQSLACVPCHAGQINQVLLNLIVNAAHASAEQGDDSKRGTITFRTKQNGDFAEISITDTGKGMSAATKDKIFEPFFTTKPIGVGTGQGLSIVYSVVEKHGGSIDVESTVGVGSTFTLRLPIQGADELASSGSQLFEEQS